MVRIIGADGAEKFAEVNGYDEMTGEVKNDLSRGKFDVAVTVGPSFSSQRQEAAETYMAIAQAAPPVFGVAGDLIFKALDLPYSDQIAERLKTMLPPQIQQMEQGDKEMPPEVMAAMQQAEQAMQQVQMMGQEIQQAAQQVETDKAGIEKGKAELGVARAQLQTQEAQIATQVAQFQKLVAETQAKMAQAEASDGGEQNAQEREVLISQVDQALQAINAQAEQFMQAAAQMLQQMQAITAQPVVVREPKRKIGKVKRVNGGFVAEIVDEATGAPLQQIQAQRVNGEMVFQSEDV